VTFGTQSGRPDVRLLGGWFVFGSPDAGLLVSLLPSLMHVRGIERLATLVRFVDEETSESKPGRDRSRHVGHARRRYARAVVANRLFV